jgi:hypothetical protein
MPLDYAHQTPSKIGVYAHVNFSNIDAENRIVGGRERHTTDCQDFCDGRQKTDPFETLNTVRIDDTPC